MMAGDKIRLRFAKTGTLRLLSHHDLMRAAERMLRRAELPFRSTKGFHPTPRLVFALPCPLGADALNDVVELELTSPREPDDVLTRLNAVAPDGLIFTSAREVPLKFTASPRRAIYTLPVRNDLLDDVLARAETLLASEKVWVERMHPNPRRLNLRPFVRDITVTDSEVRFDLWVTGTGTARGEELVRLVGLGDSLRAGAVLARADLEIRDEIDQSAEPDAPPEGPPEVELLSHVAGADPAEDTPRATWGLSPAGPVVE